MNLQQVPVSELPGVGPKRLTAIESLGIKSIYDLLFYFPFRYEDMEVKDLADAVDQEKILLKGVVASDPVVAHFGYRKNRLNVRILSESESIMVTFFNQPWLKDKFETGNEVAVYGKWNEARRALTGIKVIGDSHYEGSIDSVYSVNKNIHQKTLINLIKQAFDKYHQDIVTVIPEKIREKYKLLNDEQIVKGMHFPENESESEVARRSAKFREFFLFECGIQSVKAKETQANDGIKEEYSQEFVQKFLDSLPFELTKAQSRVVQEILDDMNSSHHMNRLLQGDVGSGKTIVAVIAMLASVTAGYQAAIMAPTEILAQQHFEKISKLLTPLKLRVGILTGSQTKKEHDTIAQNIADGKINIIVGTHALIQDSVTFKKLGFIVIDEQHRFGVNQRKALRQKGENPDVLAMTATPIPRTLAITTYGDMDVSRIDELPSGRKAIETYWIRSQKIEQMYRFVQKQLEQQAQVYVVTPLISESEKIDLKNAELIFDKFNELFAPKYKIGLLHGQMPNDEKESVMNEFSNHKIDVLVSTTVIEVGVDVPNATVMVIYDANRFGLSQLHQLRGRVGRGDKQSYCILIADPKNDIALERMKILTQTTDGFVLAEEDLKMRGSGDLLGSKQSGLPDFKVGNPITDFNILETAQQEAEQLFKETDAINKPENKVLKLFLNVEFEQLNNFD
ncbi:ATP-dependent DNA helicase RecG [Companilactobacillus sp.]|jgi:ATP-dependent DNA helicase RecG|uniref:ATP-dependent DNA helicase RecG n=2 Tax=Companilactobacillus sp. TaxID=2767905 RepID=UPI0025BE8125|nr:ATP-dependent DNA helicase RecG [Companilactobacillus sp.]MCH4008046.1 ATP-dependent DNA helicase RecG [Companilactobacillus sp.]MCH4051775.1 ATP-dependent DNA helicase RecG [Companilactobacillus sp.]MCH4075989.1 ATP-dependent DNA helicase RecG [Companilactobacillus sp.]MCH4124564.1 ATP-dependent DNA helicase RecG [Companilactobacillus sp.]MCH4132473.1 ATP-dependent DNA helicase RecG [Companilactobacillus sp.]